MTKRLFLRLQGCILKRSAIFYSVWKLFIAHTLSTQLFFPGFPFIQFPMSAPHCKIDVHVLTSPLHKFLRHFQIRNLKTSVSMFSNVCCSSVCTQNITLCQYIRVVAVSQFGGRGGERVCVRDPVIAGFVISQYYVPFS